MPEYKKKRVKHKFSSKKRANTAKEDAYNSKDIVMQPKNTVDINSRKRKNINVVKGNKFQRIRKARITAVCLAVLILTVTLLSWLLPVGIVENLGNLSAMVGKGGYPFELYGSQILNSVSCGSYYYVLTDTNLNVYANSGKPILNLSHGFANPVVKTTATRAIVYDQGGTEIFISNLTKKVFEHNFDASILNAAISRCGTYAVAYTADNYASVVSVYNKKNRRLYEWHSADETVNNVAVSPNGKKIAVSTITASGGRLKSKLYVFEYSSANPVYSLDLGEELVYNIESGAGSGFSVVTKDGFKYIKWSKFNTTEYTTDLQMSLLKSSSDGIVAVSTLAGNKGDNKIAIFNKNGKMISEFSFNGIISDIQISHNHIYCMSDTNVFIYSRSGELLRTDECDFGAVKFAVISAYSIAVIKNDEVSRLEIKK